MNYADIYTARIDAIGSTKRNASLKREQRFIRDHLVDSLSYHVATIDGEEQQLAIMNSDNLNEKYVYSMPGEEIHHGGILEWMDTRWLITEMDYSNEVYTKAKAMQCNYLLKWIDSDGVVHEQWSIVEDGTKLKRTRCTQRFGILETICKNYSLLCWDTLRALLPKQNSEQLYMAMV